MAHLLAHSDGDMRKFPSMPERLAYVRVPDRLRRFGTRSEDLQIDFSLPRASLTTAILDLCGCDAAGQACNLVYAPALELGKRLECLLVLAMMDQATRELTLTCPHQDCKKRMTLELTLDELSQLQHEAEIASEIAIGDSPALRRPTAQDLEQWRSSVYADEAEAREVFVSILLLDGVTGATVEPVLARWPGLSDALADADPLIDFAVTTHCPHCERESLHPFDLEGFALGELARSRQNLIGEIHKLAFHYHWTEEVILGLPQWRRRAYLELVHLETRRDGNMDQGGPS